MRLRVALAGLAALAAVGAGLGIGLALQSSGARQCIPKERDSVFERARSRGLIDCYTVTASSPYDFTVVADGGDVMVRYMSSPGDNGSIRINYRSNATWKAGQFARIIHRVYEHPRVSLAPSGVFP